MNHNAQLTAARLYMIFALILLALGWQLCKGATAQISQTQARQAALTAQILSQAE